jgi:hypothetical protein
MLQALQAAEAKLSDYYSQTDCIRGDLYAMGTMLAPANKFQFLVARQVSAELQGVFISIPGASYISTALTYLSSINNGRLTS